LRPGPPLAERTWTWFRFIDELAQNPKYLGGVSFFLAKLTFGYFYLSLVFGDETLLGENHQKLATHAG
jgi:hypothetical protein